MSLKLSILDQSLVNKGVSAGEALQQTVEMAKLADHLGYTRFWVSEHHNMTAIAGSAPEILMVKLADATQHIRVGSGGIMLPNHSALKVAENFRMLEALFPGRIDLGIGRAPGGDRVTAYLLNPSNNFSEESYRQQLDYLQLFFSDTASTENGRILAIPQAATTPEQWMLSSSGGSSKIAAEYGMGLAVAKFINGDVQPEVVQEYQQHFKPSAQFPEPHAILSIIVLCAETPQKALEMRKVLDYRFIQMERGNFTSLSTYDEIRNYEFSDMELIRIRANASRVISGTPETVKPQLEKLASDFGVNEIVVTTMADYPERKRSFELLAEAFALNKRLVAAPH
ncbi:LLM class flavin-dependent oxidoreductase [Adhaeribacter rhizoryzae]|uniref:Luciferase-like monooxygenase n=1 Tax=Adhaeribacter rhizoryzae TaxID=2607907 RepID=A0A5M6DN40_9BACT|nr:LLM class flavin-dependent oxidoreductase [Adhaeribacter rhizoryzae]KAA5547796.1 LLM class flavin-dependent oxidoreductase [Adhaeribacter rhizoryzae]